jgi:hypothetical protein
MSKLSILVKRYTSTSKTKGFSAYDEIDASKKWAEYSVDEYKIRQLMQGVDFTEKFDAEKALTIVRRKIEWMYKHRNFDVSEATLYYKKLKRLVG